MTLSRMTPMELLEAQLTWAIAENEQYVTVPTEDLRSVLAWVKVVLLAEEKRS